MDPVLFALLDFPSTLRHQFARFVISPPISVIIFPWICIICPRVLESRSDIIAGQPTIIPIPLIMGSLIVPGLRIISSVVVPLPVIPYREVWPGGCWAAAQLAGELTNPREPTGVVLFGHASRSSSLSPQSIRCPRRSPDRFQDCVL
jgi:hypothetical protein